MAWSTRELAELAGTTLNTVRHYHRVGLLDEPERRVNGYKQYGVPHLVRLLQIRRLRDLGVPLDRIEQVGGPGATSQTALEALDADLASSIERLQRARAEIRAILQGTTVTDVPAGFEDVAANLSPSERSLMLIYSRLYDEEAMADIRRMLEWRTDVDDEFDALPADADDDVRRRLAERYAPLMAKAIADHPWTTDPSGRLRMHPRVAGETFAASVTALYNPAQIDVLVRASRLAAGTDG